MKDRSTCPEAPVLNSGSENPGRENDASTIRSDLVQPALVIFDPAKNVRTKYQQDQYRQRNPYSEDSAAISNWSCKNHVPSLAAVEASRHSLFQEPCAAMMPGIVSSPKRLSASSGDSPDRHSATTSELPAENLPQMNRRLGRDNPASLGRTEPFSDPLEPGSQGADEFYAEGEC